MSSTPSTNAHTVNLDCKTDSKGNSSNAQECSFFKAGYCKKGEVCPFAHGKVILDPRIEVEVNCSFPGVGSTPSAAASALMFDSKIDSKRNSSNSPECSFFNAGYCKKGEACPFGHKSVQ